MKRLLILLTLLTLCIPTCMAEVVIIGSEQIYALNEPCIQEDLYAFTVQEISLQPSSEQGKQKLSVECYLKNLSHDTVEFSEVTSMTLVFREKFELPLAFETYTHVRKPVAAAAPFPLEPLVEILGVWSADVPDVVANAGEGELMLRLTIDSMDYSVPLR